MRAATGEGAGLCRCCCCCCWIGLGGSGEYDTDDGMTSRVARTARAGGELHMLWLRAGEAWTKAGAEWVMLASTPRAWTACCAASMWSVGGGGRGGEG